MDAPSFPHWPHKKESYYLIVVLLLAFILFLAYRNIFIQDDAFISFRYAYNLLHARELNWNPGDAEKVEGYSNFLWTILLFGGLKLGIQPEIFSLVLSLVAMLGTLCCSFLLALQVLKSRLQALVVLLLLGTNFTFSAYGSGGLETQLQTFLLSLQCLLILRNQARPLKKRYLLFLSFLAGLSLMLRLDSALFMVVLYGYLIIQLLFFSGKVDRNSWYRLALLAGPVCLLCAAWFTWKYYYYGDILPNTYFVKTGGSTWAAMKQGLRYTYTFFSSYLLLPLLPLFLILLIVKKAWKSQQLLLCVLLFGSWLAYILYVGGDFMEFRFFVPVLPLFFLLLTWSFFQWKHVWITALLIGLVLTGSYYHFRTFYYKHGVESVNKLNAHITAEEENWVGIGKMLENCFAASEKPVRIATTAAGAIPYYAKLPTIDMLGLNDKWIARNEKVRSPRPGHQKRASIDYLMNRRVHLLVGHPQVRKKGEFLTKPVTLRDMVEFGLLPEDSSRMPSAAQVLIFPIDNQYEVAFIYLNKNPAIEQLLQKQHIVSYPLHKNEDQLAGQIQSSIQTNQN